MSRQFRKRFISYTLIFALVIGFLPSFILSPANAQMSTLQKTDVNAITASPGSYHVAALDDEGRVWTWANSNVYDEELGRAYGPSSSETASTKAAQVTTVGAADGGGTLPFILQISSSQRNTYALDRDGNIWSWGDSSYGALCRTVNTQNPATRPGKIVMPAGVKASWISGAYRGGKFVSTTGDIWVWGSGTDNALGNGGTGNVTTEPVKLTTDSVGNPLPTNFKWVTSSDYFDAGTAMAITEDGKIYTWGGGSTSEMNYLGGSRPKYIGTYQGVKKITCGNGTLGFLTDDGDVYTWGVDMVEGFGKLGTGSDSDRATPQKIEWVSTNNNNSSLVPAPKFHDFSFYAWSSLAVDVDGNLYGGGSNHNRKHFALRSTNNYLSVMVPDFTVNGEIPKIFVVEEGYTGSLYIDIYGNVYSRGNTTGGATTAEPWVHFAGTNVPMFTKLDSNPTSEVKNYSSTRTTLDVGLSRAADEVRYIILYQNDTDVYTDDGERFWDKSFAEFELPYYNKDTAPQLLLSPNYNLWTSRYYANTQISEEVFEELYAKKPASEKGTMDIVAGSGNRTFTKANVINGNCIIWVQSKNSLGTTRMIYRFDNFYTQGKVWHEGVRKDNPDYSLYLPELVPGAYGVPLTREGGLIRLDPSTHQPPFGFDTVQPIPRDLTSSQSGLAYWILDPSDQTATSNKPDPVTGILHRTDPSKEVVLDSPDMLGDDSAQTPCVTFTYSKNPEAWADVTIKYVDENGNPLPVIIGVSPGTEQTFVDFAPIGVAHVDGQDPFVPPNAVDDNNKVVGYSVDSKPSGAGSYTECTFPGGFKPIISSSGQTIYIVYQAGMVEVAETYKVISFTDTAGSPIINNSGLLETTYTVLKDDPFTCLAPAINRYTAVGFEIDGVRTMFNWDSSACAYTGIAAEIGQVSNDSSIVFLYKSDMAGTGIPDEEQGFAKVYWVGVAASGAKTALNSRTFVRNGYRGDTAGYFDSEGDKNENISEYPEKWIFNPAPAPSAPYLPAGSVSPLTVNFEMGVTKEFYLYYDEDYNENGTADRDETLTEKFRLYGDFTGQLAPDKTEQFLAGNSYHGTPPAIDGYIAVGWIHGEYTGGLSDDDIHHITENGEQIEASFTTHTDDANTVITFIYRSAAAPLVVEWVGITYGQNRVLLGNIVIKGYVGENVAALVAPPVPIDTDMWVFRSHDLPSGSLLLSDIAQHYEYLYDERITFSVINVDGASNDGKLSYSYKQEKRLIDPAFEVSAWPLPGYRVTGYEITDFYGNLLDSGTGDTVIADPATGNQNIHFSYISTITSVVVRMVDDGANEIESPIVFTDVRIGEKFSVPAPHIDGYMLSEGQPLLYVFDPIVEGTNAVVFRYEKIDVGEYSLILSETGGGIIRVTGYPPSDVVAGAPDLSGAYYVYDDENTAVFPLVMDSDNTLYYVKEYMDVIITAQNESGETIGAWTDTARKGEMYQAVAGSVQGYSLAEAPSKLVYADPSDSTLNVIFNYKRDLHGSITVSYYCLDGGSRVTFYTYTGSAVVGSKITAEQLHRDGFELKSGEPSSKEITVAEGDNLIEFEYIDIRKTLTVYVRLGEDENAEVFKTLKYPQGSSETVPVPYIGGFVAINCSVDDGTPVVISDDFEGVTVTIDNDTDVLFEYKTLDQIIREDYVTLTLSGSDGTETLYSYDILVRKDVETLVAAPTIPMYTLDPLKDENYSDGDAAAGAFGGYAVTLSADGAHTFYYRKNTAAVALEFIDEATGLMIAGTSAGSVTGIIGEQITVNAPFISDYELVSGESAAKTHTITGNTVTDKVSFMYKKSFGNVRFRYIDEDDGVILAETRDTFTLGTATAGLAGNMPALPYGWELKDGTGLPQYSSATVIIDTVITFTLSKVIRDITINYLDYHSSAPIADAQTVQAQIGRRIDIIANPSNLAAGYVPHGAVYRNILVAEADNVVNFYYLNRAVSGTGAVTVICVDEDSGSVIFYKVHDAQAEGSPYSVTAPSLPGWNHSGRDVTFDAESGTMLSSGVTVVYKYKKDIKRIEIFVGDRNGEPLIDIDQPLLTLDYTGYDEGPYTTIEVQSGRDAVINAPFFAGYTVMNQTPQIVADDDIDDAVTDGVYFRYARITTEGAVLVRCVDSTQNAPNNVINSWMQWGDIATPFSIAAPAISGYTLTGDSEANGVFGTDSVVTFVYLPTVADVTIYALDINDIPISGYLPVVLHGIRTGTAHTVVAPVIAGYEISGSYEASITPTLDGPNSVIFRYKRISGNILVTAVDKDNPGHILAMWSEVRDAGESYTAVPVQIAGWTAPASETITVTSGQNYVRLEYTKQMANVRIVAIAEGGSIDNPSDILHDETVTDVQVGSQYTAGMPYVRFHLLTDGEPTSKSITVSSGENVIVFYMKATGAPVFIIHRDSDSGAILAVCTDNGNAGEEYTAYSMNISGYLAVGDTVKTGTIPDVSQGEDPLEIFFDYSRHMGVVTVELIDRSNNSLIDSYTVDVQYERATDIHAPLVSGYTLDDVSYRTVRLDAGNSATISFIYKSFESIIAESYVNIDVKGMAGALQLYSYQMTVRKNTGNVTVNAFAVNGYRLVGAASADVNVAGNGNSVVFNYESLAATVTIHMRDESGRTISDSFVVAAVTGEAFSTNAPGINGYYLIGSSIGSISSVAADGTDEIVFTYRAIDSQVCIVAKEQDSGRVIKMIPVENPTIGAADYPTPDLSADFYEATSSTVNIDFDGINSLTVDAFYKKQLVDIPIEARDYSTGVLLPASATELAGQRKGEAVVVTAPSVSGYTLVDSASRVIIANGDAAVFRYRTLAADEVLVKAVSETSGEILQSYVLSGTVGETVFVRAPSILGRLILGADTASALVGSDKEIVFIYGKNVVTVTVTLLDKDGGTLHIPLFNPTVEVAKGGNYTAYAPHIDGYVLSSPQKEVFTNIVTDQTVVFTYKTVDEAANERYAIITIIGSTGGTVHYSYSMRVAKSGIPMLLSYPAEIFAVNGYVPVSGQEFSVTPDSDKQVDVEYEPNMTNVMIRAVYDDGGSDVPIETFTPIMVPAEKGKSFYTGAPVINGFNNTGSSQNPIVPGDDPCEIVFYYKKASGNLTVIALDGGTEIGRFVRTIQQGAIDSSDASAPTTPEIPALANYVLIPNSGVSSDTHYDGTHDVTLSYNFARKASSLTLVAVNINDGSIIAGGAATIDGLRILELYDYAGDIISTIAGFTLIPQGSTTVLVSENSADNTVNIYYAPIKSMTVPVEVRVGSETGELLYSYAVYAAYGEIVTMSYSDAPTVDGYRFNPAQSVLTAAEGTGERIIFVMDDVRAVIRVNISKNGGAPELHSTVKTVLGGSAHVYPPYLNGYVLKNAADDSIEISPVTGDTDVLFEYVRIEDVLDRFVVNIIIRGVDEKSGRQLYSYIVTKARNSGTFTVGALDVSGYQLNGAPSAELATDGGTTEHEFFYTSLAAAVTVYAELSTGGAVPGFTPIISAGIYGQPFSYNAPYIPGYVPDDSITKTIPSVAPDMNSLTFYYLPATGNVTIILREDDENGAVITSMQDTIAAGESKTIAIPNLSGDHYSAISVTPAVLSYSTGPQTVTYYYSKNLRTVEVVCFDVTAGPTELSRDAAGSYRIGEAAAFVAPLINGYKLASTTPQYVVVADGAGSMEVRFDYVTLAHDELLVAAIDSDSGDLLYSYVLGGRVGEEVTVNAPGLPGWALDSAPIVRKTIPDTALFYYSGDTIAISLTLTDTSGGDLTSLATVPVRYTAPRGGDFTVYAPHLPGYSLISGQSYVYSNLELDKTAEFIYKKNISDETSDVTISYIDYATGKLIKSEVAPGQTVGQTFVYSSPASFNFGGVKYERHASTPAIISTEVTADLEIKLYYSNKGPETIVIPGGGGGPSYETAVLTIVCIDLDSGEALYSQSVSAVVGSTETVNAPIIKGYSLAEGNPAKQTLKIATSGNKVVFNYVSDEEDIPLEHHIKYINGYTDGTVRPDGDITRAEAAAIFFRILDNNAKNTPLSGPFSDVADGEWYAQSVNYLASLGIIVGYPDGTFKPSQTMTRAEFATVAARFGGMVEYSGMVFDDVPPLHWAAKYIGSAFTLGWISGYPDGSFRPSQRITRAEVVRIVNGMLHRCIEIHDIPAYVTGYTDLLKSHWAYTEIIEASYRHESTRKDNGYELWTDSDE